MAHLSTAGSADLANSNASLTDRHRPSSVAPSISFGRMNGFVTRVYAGRSMARKQVQLQRLSPFGQWVTIKRISLDLSSRARFTASLPPGVSRLRIAMSVNQAGAGYLAAFSKEISWRRVK